MGHFLAATSTLYLVLGALSHCFVRFKSCEEIVGLSNTVRDLTLFCSVFYFSLYLCMGIGFWPKSVCPFVILIRISKH